MSQMTPIDVVIIGGGQAGLAMSYYLSQQGVDHIILEQGRIAESWRTERWDSFKLVTPNWAIRLPGYEYQGEDPDGFMTRNAIIKYLESYAASFHAPIQFGVHVTSVSRKADHYVIETTMTSPLEAKNVVIATGEYQQSKVPRLREDMSERVQYLHSSLYRNARELAPGNVLVVGSGQSGCQIAEELNQAGRKVYLAVSNCGRLPRQYRGRDIVWWQNMIGVYDRTIDQLPSPSAKFVCHAPLSSERDINPCQLEQEGVVLLGRLQSIQADKVIIAPNLVENLEKAEQFAEDIKRRIDEFAQIAGIQVPEPEDLNSTKWKERHENSAIHMLDMTAHGITNVIWATGYKQDFSWVHIPVFDKAGYPIHKRGVTNSPGLYFLGLRYLYKNKSSLLLGVGEDAAFLATEITDRCSKETVLQSLFR